ncbi:hypothetical protein B7P43_G14733 [Cryptotermes secundus]|uniref:RING-type E3 ubiquitin transferase n=1 Tax=Cryptotermes secundus TaxID=105785 RepID=A0A2J7PWL6_9NEOP|nr:hypothetical protein B7P43_G14733 [Cryptotermes secundus]
MDFTVSNQIDLSAELQGLPITSNSSATATNATTVSAEVASLFECPVCFDYILPPILQCRNGHLICSNCRPKLTCCPICSVLLENIHCWAMEKVASAAMFPCKYSTSGCAVALIYTERREHEETCEFRPCSCPFQGASCTWQGSFEQVMPHLMMYHELINLLTMNTEYSTRAVKMDFTVSNQIDLSAELQGLPITSNSSATATNATTVSAEVASLFECPVCFDYILPPILQCQNGHLICSNCRPKLTCCPICSVLLENIHCWAMEKVASAAMFPCKYSTSGCAVALIYTERREHEETCEFRPCSCPFQGASCTWQGSFEQVMPHLMMYHELINLLTMKILNS